MALNTINLSDPALVNCKHLWEYRWHRGTGLGMYLGFSCKKCRSELDRRATAGERKFFKKHHLGVEIHPPPERDVHFVWHKFVKMFKGTPKDPYAYKYEGYDLIARIERWAPRYPNKVWLQHIDDAHHCNALLVVVEHSTSRDYMGLTCVVVSQCTPRAPVEFFLYPSDHKGLAKLLTGLLPHVRAVRKIERQTQRKQAALIRKWLKPTPVL